MSTSETASGWTRIAGSEHAVRRAPFIVGLEQKLSLKLSQRLVMTPTLQQAIKLLQMTRLELQDVVTQEIVENPVLEEDETTEAPAGAEAEEPRPPRRSGRRRGTAPTARATEPERRRPGRLDLGRRERPSRPRRLLPSRRPGTAEAEIPAESTQESSFEAIDLESYFGDYLEGSSSTAPRMSEEGEEFSLENRAEAPPGLDAHLAEQLGVSEASAVVREACAFMIGNVDADGYLRVTLPEVCTAIPCTEAEAARGARASPVVRPVGRRRPGPRRVPPDPGARRRGRRRRSSRTSSRTASPTWRARRSRSWRGR